MLANLVIFLIEFQSVSILFLMILKFLHRFVLLSYTSLPKIPTMHVILARSDFPQISYSSSQRHRKWCANNAFFIQSTSSLQSANLQTRSWVTRISLVRRFGRKETEHEGTGSKVGKLAKRRAWRLDGHTWTRSVGRSREFKMQGKKSGWDHWRTWPCSMPIIARTYDWSRLKSIAGDCNRVRTTRARTMNRHSYPFYRGITWSS